MNSPNSFDLPLQDTLVEKLRLKNSQLKVQKMKLDLQFKQVQYTFCCESITAVYSFQYNDCIY